MHEWHDILERDIDRVHHGMWVGYLTDHLSDPVILFKNEVAFDPPFNKTTRMIFLVPIPCFKMRPQAKCLQEWKKPKGEFEGA